MSITMQEYSAPGLPNRTSWMKNSTVSIRVATPVTTKYAFRRVSKSLKMAGNISRILFVALSLKTSKEIGDSSVIVSSLSENITF